MMVDRSYHIRQESQVIQRNSIWNSCYIRFGCKAHVRPLPAENRPTEPAFCDANRTTASEIHITGGGSGRGNSKCDCPGQVTLFNPRQVQQHCIEMHVFVTLFELSVCPRPETVRGAFTMQDRAQSPHVFRSLVLQLQSYRPPHGKECHGRPRAIAPL
jgi:hypothetical protein